MIHALPVALLVLSAQAPSTRAEGPPPGWFVLRLKTEEALVLFKNFARRRENLPAGCSYGGKARIGDLERTPEGPVGEIEYRLLCYEATPMTAAPEFPRSPAVEKEKEIRGGTNPQPHIVREKFLFVWTGEAWRLKGRAQGAGKPPVDKPPEGTPRRDPSGAEVFRRGNLLARVTPPGSGEELDRSPRQDPRPW